MSCWAMWKDGGMIWVWSSCLGNWHWDTGTGLINQAINVLLHFLLVMKFILQTSICCHSKFSKHFIHINTNYLLNLCILIFQRPLHASCVFSQNTMFSSFSPHLHLLKYYSFFHQLETPLQETFNIMLPPSIVLFLSPVSHHFLPHILYAGTLQPVIFYFHFCLEPALLMLLAIVTLWSGAYFHCTSICLKTS